MVLPGSGEAPSAHLLRADDPELRGTLVSALSLDNPRCLDNDNNVLHLRVRSRQATGEELQVANIPHQLGPDVGCDSRLPRGISRY